MHLMKGVMHMELSKKIVNLKCSDGVSFLSLEENSEVKLFLTDDGKADIECFFTSLINLLLEEQFELQLISDKQSPQIIEEVAEKYIERLNIEIKSILQLDEYKVFSSN